MTAQDTIDRVAFVEPRCHGLEHVPFNASLIATVLAAYPEATVDAYGEREHLGELERLLALTRPAVTDRVRWHPIEIPARRAKGWDRARQTHQLFGNLTRHLRQQRVTRVVVATTDPFVVILLKARLWSTWADLSAVAVVHELLAVLQRQSSRRWGLLAALRMPHPRRLSYIVLSPSILLELHRLEPGAASRTIAVEHPSLLGDLPVPHQAVERTRLRFGFVGGGRDAKGFHEFLEVVNAVRREQPDVDFEIVGSAPADLPRAALAHLTWSEQKLPLVEFVARLKTLSYVIWLGDPKHYQLVASGSLVDALSLGIPVICRSGSLVDHLFEHLGEVGVRCDGLADVQKAVLQLNLTSSNEQHRRHREAAGAARVKLAPEVFVPQLQQALDRR